MPLPTISEIVNPHIVAFRPLVPIFQVLETPLFLGIGELSTHGLSTALSFHIALSGKDEYLQLTGFFLSMNFRKRVRGDAENC